MTIKDVRILFITIFGLTLVVIFLKLINQIDIGQGISLLITSILVLITAVYVRRTGNIADETKKQAEASLKMAEEMRENRYDTVRPIIDIRRTTNKRRQMEENVAGSNEHYGFGFACSLINIGLGPALEIQSNIRVDFEKTKIQNFGVLSNKDRTDEELLSPKQGDGRKALVVTYKDIYGQFFESSREVKSIKYEGWEIGPLKISQLKRKNHD